MNASKPHSRNGNLRSALIDAGIALIREGGPDALSIRKVAALAGVSHAAPAHYFPSLTHLRTAVAAEAHRRFTASMEDAISEAPAGPRDALIAATVGYTRFARENPGLFHVMFGGAPKNAADADLCAASDASYAVLARVCAPVAHGPAGPKGTETLVWSLAHGFSSLMLAGLEGLQDPDDAERLLAKIFPDLPISGEGAT